MKVFRFSFVFGILIFLNNYADTMVVDNSTIIPKKLEGIMGNVLNDFEENKDKVAAIGKIANFFQNNYQKMTMREDDLKDLMYSKYLVRFEDPILKRMFHIFQSYHPVDLILECLESGDSVTKLWALKKAYQQSVQKLPSEELGRLKQIGGVVDDDVLKRIMTHCWSIKTEKLNLKETFRFYKPLSPAIVLKQDLKEYNLKFMRKFGIPKMK